MAGIKAQEQMLLLETSESQSKKMSEAFDQMQTHKVETDKLLESYNDRFSECQHSIEKSNEVSRTCSRHGIATVLLLIQTLFNIVLHKAY